LVEETGIPGENHWLVPSHWYTLSYNVVSSTPPFWFWLQILENNSFSGVCILKSFVFCVMFCRSLHIFLSFSFSCCIVCPLIYGFWLPLWLWWHATDQWFSPGTPVSSTNKTDCHNVTEILLKVVLNTITLTSRLKIRCQIVYYSPS
jgi:hypothetical protein